jgi:ribosome recycling factor
MVKDIIAEAEKRMIVACTILSEELKKIRTNRANSSLVEDLPVSYYGSTISLKEAATITAPEPSLIQIKPFDRNAIGDIELTIRNSDLGLSPINDGTFIRISIPPLTEERRKELTSQVKRVGESAKVQLRTVRGEAWSKVQEAVRRGDATEDDKYRSEKELNELIERKNKEVDKIISDKESEVMKV